MFFKYSSYIFQWYFNNHQYCLDLEPESLDLDLIFNSDCFFFYIIINFH